MKKELHNPLLVVLELDPQEYVPTKKIGAGEGRELRIPGKPFRHKYLLENNSEPNKTIIFSKNDLKRALNVAKRKFKRTGGPLIEILKKEKPMLENQGPQDQSCSGDPQTDVCTGDADTCSKDDCCQK